MNRVKEFRTKAKMRLVDLAVKANVSVTWIWYLENGYDERISKEIKTRIVEALGCEYRVLFPDESESPEAVESKTL